MIAVVDDEESVRKAVVRVLQAAGYTARAFASGSEFLEAWHFQRPIVWYSICRCQVCRVRKSSRL
jgi:FixJ family two-component response regulator